jgi:protein-disulfide isomerase
MENRNMNEERWVEERLQALGSGNEWQPDAATAFVKLQRRERRRRSWQRRWQRRWIWSTAIASVAAVVMIALPPQATCAIAGVGCPRLPAPAVGPAAAKPTAVVRNIPVPRVTNYKESGSPAAPVVCEIYSDYECPACAGFYRDILPLLLFEYVKTGKVRIVHRDFPLPQHAFAKLAARYANAAGELGHYDEVVTQLFASQPEWAASGNIDAAVAQILPRETMRKLRALIESDPKLDATVAADLSKAAQDQINQTPTVVFVHKGVRTKVAGIQSFDLLRNYLEELVTLH